MVEREKFDYIEERLRVIKGVRNYAFADMPEMCLVTDMVILPKFKVPDFNKYKGTTCPKNHLKMYYRKMVRTEYRITGSLFHSEKCSFNKQTFVWNQKI